MSVGASPSGKAAGFGPAISEVRILSPQILKRPYRSFFYYVNYNNKHSFSIRANAHSMCKINNSAINQIKG